METPNIEVELDNPDGHRPADLPDPHGRRTAAAVQVPTIGGDAQTRTPTAVLGKVAEELAGQRLATSMWDVLLMETLERTVFVDDSREGTWLYNSRRDGWRQYGKRSDIQGVYKELAVALGFPLNVTAGGVAWWDWVTRRVMDQTRCSYAGPLAGYAPGLYEAGTAGRERIFVTDGPRLIQPVAGEWETIQEMLARMFSTPEEHRQMWRFLAWLKVAYESIYKQAIVPKLILAICGQPSAGKSRLQQDIITPLLGGRATDPYSYATGGTSFNAEQFGAEHLTVEDRAAHVNAEARRVFGDWVKSAAAVEWQRCHPKGKNAVMLRPNWACTISTNSDASSVLVLPDIDRQSVADKVLILHAMAHPQGMPMPTDTPEQKAAFRRQLAAELPALAHWLLNWELPEYLRCPRGRFGCAAWVAPEVLAAVRDDNDAEEFLEFVDRYLFPKAKGGEDLVCDAWTGGASALRAQMATIPGMHPQNLPHRARSARTLGILLSELANSHPARVQRITGRPVLAGGERPKSAYRITPPPSEGTVPLPLSL